MAAKYQVRLAESNRDLDKIRSLNVKTLSENYSKAFWKFAIESGTPHFVAVTGENNNRIVGYAATMVHCGKFMIYSIAVEAQHRNGGVGTLLMRALVDYLERFDAVRDDLVLNVRVGNAVAIKLYRRHGFVDKEIMPGYYGNGENSLEMILVRKKK
jgi:ribosomal-protein-alanine N-acetyltransferase